MVPQSEILHYSEKFTRDVDLRRDLVLLGWHIDVKLVRNLISAWLSTT